ncbi:MAG TPA: ribosome maturation factor RimM [Candidatus Dormibacteraeota bacterium]
MTAPAQPDLRIGRVLRAHGVRGGVRVESLTDFSDRFASGALVMVGGRRLTVARSNETPGSLLITFVEIGDREAAERLTGSYITVPLDQAHPLPRDHYYHFQLVGLTVVDGPRERTLGTVAEVLRYPANDVLRVAGVTGEVLVPMVRSVVRSVDVTDRLITVDLPLETEP